MKKHFAFSITVLVLTILSACATVPTPAGKWTTTMESPQGPMRIGFDFKVDGRTLTGTTSNDFTGAIPISEGMVKGKELSFKVKFEGGGISITSNYTGVLEKDQIKLNMKFEGTPPPGAPANIEFVADRVKEK